MDLDAGSGTGSPYRAAGPVDAIFGTDFSFEDLEERDVNQFDYKLLGPEVVEGQQC